MEKPLKFRKMKKIKIILMLIAVVFVTNSCSKKDDDVIIDCFGDSILTSLKHSADATNSKIVNYSIEYSGSNTVSSVKWTFGDGTPAQTVSANGAVSHTYTAAGTFEVTADVTLSKDGGSCTVSPKKNVTVN
jgi:hypothetical protein